MFCFSIFKLELCLGMATTTEEDEDMTGGALTGTDQPVDLTGSGQMQTTTPNNNNPSSRYSILSQYLKSGKISGDKKRSLAALTKGLVDDNEAASISKAAEVFHEKNMRKFK